MKYLLFHVLLIISFSLSGWLFYLDYSPLFVFILNLCVGGFLGFVSAKLDHYF